MLMYYLSLFFLGGSLMKKYLLVLLSSILVVSLYPTEKDQVVEINKDRAK